MQAMGYDIWMDEHEASGEVNEDLQRRKGSDVL